MLVHQLVLYHILDFLHAGRPFHVFTCHFHIIGNLLNLLIAEFFIIDYRCIRFLYSRNDLIRIKKYLDSASLNNFHVPSSSQSLSL